MNYPKKEARVRVWGGESWLLVSMINYKFTMNIAKNKTEDMMALNIQDPWNICKLWGRSLIISWPLVFAHFCYSGWMLNLFGCVIHAVTSPWHSNLIVFSVAMSSSSRYNPPSGKNKTKQNTVLNFSVKLSFGFLSVSSRISEHCFWSLMEFVVGSRKEAFSPFPSPIRETLKKKKKAFECGTDFMSVDRLAFLYPGSSLPMEGRKNQSSGVELSVAFPVVHVCGAGYKAG